MYHINHYHDHDIFFMGQRLVQVLHGHYNMFNVFKSVLKPFSDLHISYINIIFNDFQPCGCGHIL